MRKSKPPRSEMVHPEPLGRWGQSEHRRQVSWLRATMATPSAHDQPAYASPQRTFPTSTPTPSSLNSGVGGKTPKRALGHAVTTPRSCQPHPKRRLCPYPCPTAYRTMRMGDQLEECFGSRAGAHLATAGGAPGTSYTRPNSKI